MLKMKKLELLLMFIFSAITVQQTRAGVELRFGENDYSNVEGIPLSISISRSGFINDEIAVTVTSKTFEQYWQGSPSQRPCSNATLEELRDGRDYAEVGDFALGMFPGQIPPGSQQKDGYITINLINDTLLEKNEVFVLILNTSHPDITITRPCALGVIRENGHASFRVEFELTVASDRSLVEHAGTTNSLRIVKRGEIEFTIYIQITTDGEAEEGLDYRLDIESQQNAPAEPYIISMTPQEESITIPITIIDDHIAEETESFRITGQLTDININQISQDFEIADNDYAQMGFINMSTVNVMEGKDVTLCASLLNITVENFQRYNQYVDIYTVPGTALVDKHFIPQRREGLSFFKIDRSNPHCITIPTINDTVEEGPRDFTVRITDSIGSPPHPLNILHPRMVTVEIIKQEIPTCGENDVPYKPMITYFNHTSADKMLHVTWTDNNTVDSHHPIDQYRVTFRVSEKNDGMVHTHTFNVTNTEMEYTIDNIDEGQYYGVEICAVNICGESCDEIPLTSGVVPIVTVDSIPPNIVIIIVVVVVFLLLLLLFLLLSVLLCLWWHKRTPKPALVSPTHHTQHFVQLHKREESPPTYPPTQQQLQIPL